MNDYAQAAFILVKRYRKQGKFRATVPIDFSSVGAARYLSYLAYPKVTEEGNRERFEEALLSGTAREYGLQKGSARSREELAKLFGLEKVLAWRDIDAAYNGRGDKVGGGIKRLEERFHAYHVFRANDSAQADLVDVTFTEVLEKVSVAYESERSKLSEPEVRTRNLKRSFANSRAVLHLTGGMIAAHRAKGWCNEQGQLNRGLKPALGDWSWLPEALERADLELGLLLLEHESEKMTDKQLRKHKFEPSEVIDLRLV